MRKIREANKRKQARERNASKQGKEIFLFFAFAFVLAYVLLHEFFSVNILAFALALASQVSKSTHE